MPFPTLFSSSVEDSKNIPFIANKIRTTFNPNKILQVVWSANAFVTNTYNPVASIHPNMQALEITAINSIKTENIHSIILSKNFILFSSIYIECLDRRQVGQFIQRKAFLPFAVCQGNELFYTKISFL